MNDASNLSGSRSTQGARTCAIVVTYQPDDALAQRLARLRAQVDHVVIVDNGSDARLLERALGPARDDSGVTLLANGANLGIAAALNRGLQWAAEREFGFVLTMDQDSMLEPDALRALHAVYAQGAEGPIGLVASAYFPHVPMANGVPSARPVTATITSGNLLPLSVVAAVGGFDDSLFIDWVDIEYCLRLRRAGYVLLETTERLMQHSIGAATPVRIAGVSLMASNHSARRRYYQYRNAVLVTKRYAGFAPWYLARAWLGLAKTLVIVAWAERGRRTKLAAAMQGLWDGLLGRRGAWELSHAR